MACRIRDLYDPNNKSTLDDGMNRQAALSLREQRNQQRLHSLEPTYIESENADQTMPFWQKVLLFLPIIYASIYLIGLMYHVGYLSEFRLEPYEFQQPADITLVRGGYSLFSTSAGSNRYIPVAFLAYLLLTIIFSFTITSKKTNKKTLCSEQKNKLSRRKLVVPNIEENVFFKNVDNILSISVQLLLLLTAFFSLIILVTMSMQSGIADAKRHQDELSLPDSTDMMIVSPFLNDGPYIRVTCNTSHCAYWNKTGTLILRHDQVDQTLLLPPKEAKKS